MSVNKYHLMHWSPACIPLCIQLWYFCLCYTQVNAKLVLPPAPALIWHTDSDICKCSKNCGNPAVPFSNAYLKLTQRPWSEIKNSFPDPYSKLFWQQFQCNSSAVKSVRLEGHTQASFKEPDTGGIMLWGVTGEQLFLSKALIIYLEKCGIL